uniref:Uncharacterized protein n=1 Tax=Chromera velia CCMP2878 TaxID=1169474 RepID=A0A0G4HJ37_9ALVE|eukprot:Cvel_28015.t1-p1 / transcript=Cvel_28015.t1 / gene=Cvel_28015 / organism=Chromera_velia_CCMP2878 / gene_product=Ankyrin-3, putative / transcript_product=Ankyrin-3, putative / location=Cvel_scaffold3593:10090-11223(+) / protein_length=378 / sequence_SO=supercontig / SO=protein_coding / is_pseudo=false
MERTASTLVPVREGLRTLAESLREAAGMVDNMDALLGTIKFHDNPKGDGTPSADRPKDNTSSALLPAEAASLSRLTKLVEDMKKGVRVELNKIISLHYRMDLEPLVVRDVGKVLRSFQAVTAEVLREAVNAFMETGEKGKKEDLEFILKLGAAVDTVMEVPQAAAAGGHGEHRTLQETALMRAVNFGSLEAVKILVGAGAGLEVLREGKGFEGGKRALHIACREGKPEIAEFLVFSGAEKEAVTDAGVTPIAYAASAGQVGLVKFLLGRGADMHKQMNDGRTPLHLATAGGKKDVVELLLNEGARPEDKGEHASSVLHHTAILYDDIPSDHKEIAELLVSRGADLSAKDRYGRTVLHDAAWNGALGVVEVLLENGANV